MELFDVLKKRHSIRTYTGEPIPEETLKKILQAGLLSPSGRSIRPWELIVVRDKEMLAKMALSRTAGAVMLQKADAAIVVLGDETKTDVWTEDCSILLSNMHLMAEDLGVGSCWIQGRLRQAPGDRTTEDYLRECLGFPEHLRLEAILSLGMPARHPKEADPEAVPFEKVHYERY